MAESIRIEEGEHKAAAVEEPVAKSSGEEKNKTEDGKRRPQNKQYTAADFLKVTAAVEETSVANCVSFPEVVQQAPPPC